MELLNDVKIKCEECGNIIMFPKEYLEIEVSSYDRGMGLEQVYDIYGNYTCEQCGNYVRYRISAFEYPVGSFNHENYEIYGGQFLEIPHMGIVCRIELDEEALYKMLTPVMENIMRILDNKNYVYQITPREFEEVVEMVFKGLGFETCLTSQTRDGGKDIIATKSILGKPIVFYVECKRYDEKNKIGIDIVRSVYGVQMADKVNQSIIVTSTVFTEDARQFAEQQKTLINLIDINELIELMNKSLQNEQGNYTHRI